MASAAPPAELKAIGPFLNRANELSKADPVIAYWCTYHAVQQALNMQSRSDESNVFLVSLMDRLESSKAELAEHAAVNDDAAASAYVETFALKVFVQADNEDRNGKATKVTAQKFLAASNFLELLRIFGEPTADVKEKIKYCKWKTTDILKAIKEGRRPTPGPAGGEDDDEGLPGVSDAEQKELARELAGLGTDDERSSAVMPGGGDTPAASTRSHAALSPSSLPPSDTPSYPFPQEPTAPPSAPSPATSPSLPPPPPPPIRLDSEDAIPSPYIPPSTAPSAPDLASAPADPLPSPGASATGFNAAVFPPAPPAAGSTRPAAPAPLPSSAKLEGSLPPAAPAASLTPSQVAEIQKHAKWAISALNYEDVDTARKELQLALSKLG